MKQIQKTESILARLRQSLGAGVDVESLRVYEAIALNTLPLRKMHPLYNGSRAERGLLLEMAAALSMESRPIQIQHDQDELPLGRVFHGEVLDRGTESELRVLFFLDTTAETEVSKIEAGTVDQVSVSVLPRQILNSKSGFDYLGPEATFEHVWSGTDPDGNTIGKNGVYGRLVGLDKFFELSLVGSGGAQNARIVSREESHFGSSYQKLAASGLDPNVFVLTASASARTEDMDLTQLVSQLTDTKVDLAAKTNEISALTTQLQASVARVADLEAQVEAAGDPAVALAEKDAQLAESTTSLEAAVSALQEVAKKVLTAAGKLDVEVPATVSELSALIDETTTTLAASLVAGGRSQDAVDDAEKTQIVSLSAFRTRK